MNKQTPDKVREHYYAEAAYCGKCGHMLRFPLSGLNHAKIAKCLGTRLYCTECDPAADKKIKMERAE